MASFPSCGDLSGDRKKGKERARAHPNSVRSNGRMLQKLTRSQGEDHNGEPSEKKKRKPLLWKYSKEASVDIKIYNDAK